MFKQYLLISYHVYKTFDSLRFTFSIHSGIVQFIIFISEVDSSLVPLPALSNFDSFLLGFTLVLLSVGALRVVQLLQDSVISRLLL